MDTVHDESSHLCYAVAGIGRQEDDALPDLRVDAARMAAAAVRLLCTGGGQALLGEGITETALLTSRAAAGGREGGGRGGGREGGREGGRSDTHKISTIDSEYCLSYKTRWIVIHIYMYTHTCTCIYIQH